MLRPVLNSYRQKQYVIYYTMKRVKKSTPKVKNCKKIYKRVIVDYGQSLSEIAYTFINNEQYENRNIYPSGYDLVDEICLINGISKSDTLQVGTILTVPCYILKEDFKEEEKINSTVEVDNNYNDSYGRHL